MMPKSSVEHAAHSFTGHPMVATRQHTAERVAVSNGAARTETSQISRLVNKPCFLMVSITQTMLFVHRSLQLPITDDWYQIVLELVGDAEPVLRQIVDDPGMMLGKAEHLLYALLDE